MDEKTKDKIDMFYGFLCGMTDMNPTNEPLKQTKKFFEGHFYDKSFN